MTALVIILIVTAVVFAVLFLMGMAASNPLESDRQLEIARANRQRRLAEARIDHLTKAAIRQMSEAAAPHSPICLCARCSGRRQR